jgi:YesN/AraC family two-component response regulator
MQEKIAKIREYKMLFVEDEEDLISIITDTLTKLKIDFLTARNGQEALEVINENSDIDVVITDINMPYMNGLELIEKLNEIRPSLPVIIMSAHTETEYIKSAKELGVDNYLLKPFDFMKFIELMASLDLKK